MSVPEDLRNVLEQCLAEDATPDNLELYLPTVRQIITNLLQGLRGKQAMYGRIVRRGSEQSGHDRTDSRSSRGEKSSRRGEGSHRSQGSRSIPEGERLDRDSTSSRKSRQSSRLRDDTPQSTPGPDEEDRFIGHFTISPQPSPGIDDENTITSSQPPARRPQVPSADILPTPPPQPSQQLPLDHQSSNTTSKPVASSGVPASVKRYSLVDKPVPTSPPSVVVEPSSPSLDELTASSSPEAPPAPEVPAAVATSLAALKKNDVLERRASKRFSTFNISKMTGSSITRERSGRSNPNRRSLAVSSALTPGELAVLTEVDEGPSTPGSPVRREGSLRSRSISRGGTPERRQEQPPVPKLPSHVKTQEPQVITEQSEQDLTPNQAADSSTQRITVFLQVGREVKKAIVEQNLSFSSLRVLFVDKFSYNPGLDNFPAIYIRDPSSGVQYELEDPDEVKEKCLLSLNIERE